MAILLKFPEIPIPQLILLHQLELFRIHTQSDIYTRTTWKFCSNVGNATEPSNRSYIG